MFLRPPPRAALRYVAEDSATGYGDAADRLVRAVRGLGTEVEWRGWSDTAQGAAPALVPFSRDEHPRQRVGRAAITVAHLVPEHYPAVRGVVGDGPFVAHTVWETDRLPAQWPQLLNDTDAVIVPSEWNREVFAESGVTAPIAVVPHVVCDPVPGDRGARLALPDDVTVFYTIGRWDERKAVHLTVRAFLEAFRGSDPVVLVVKTGPATEMPPDPGFGADHPLAYTTGWQLAALIRNHPDPPRIRLEPQSWSTAEIAGLHHRGDVFVALARGEGWGMGAFDACAYGNPVVMTGWGGQLTYLDPAATALVESRLVPIVHHVPSSYSPDQHWAEPDVAHAVELMRSVAGDLPAARRRAESQQARVLREFAPARVAEGFLAALGLRGGA